MMRTYFSSLCLLLVVGCAGCGGHGGTSLANGGALQLVVTGAKAVADAPARTRVTSYRVIISGPDIAPIDVLFDGTVDSGIIDGIPVGTDRRIDVTAQNADGEGGETAAVEVALDIVPIFANLRDGNTVPNTRLRLDLLGAPGHLLEVETGALATGVAADMSTGAATVVPPRLAPGQYEIRVRDLKTGRASTVAVQIVDGTKRRGAPLVVAGSQATEVGDAIGVIPPALSGSWPMRSHRFIDHAW
ncbi:MAG: hypothetical protein HYV03_02165 [Deltaproteobacteria bacterium]|nr:hypothetical protein [Deltaproteobacteria bacterium]